jgi:predicted ThiF/HesA family dinucleotide-utilizing enzyme
MSKPWDKLRVVATPKPPIQEGRWFTTTMQTRVDWTLAEPYRGIPCVHVCLDGRRISPSERGFTITGARELGEFLIELADQLEAT